MPLATGSRVGTYEVVCAIGAGGMGEVYRARDTSLRRDVAIKVLPAEVAADSDRLARFEREAHVLAALNHPNIASIYGIVEGQGFRGLVLELVEGETLAQRIAAGPLEIHDALDIAVQIADALDASHEKGILHRDLKPSNIKITPAGRVKVLDFGLAKAYREAAVTPGPDPPTVTAALTGAATILGTAAFMSPEQARGRPLDKRTDIWAFGCVLFEMFTGRPAFARETISDTIAAVLEREPDWSALPNALPQSVLWLLTRCLEKDPKRRLRDAGDLRVQLEDALRADGSIPVTPATKGHEPRRRVHWRAAILLAALVAVIALAVIARRRPDPARAEVLRSSIVLPLKQQLDQGSSGYPLALSPDGTRLVYGAVSNQRTQLYVRDLTQFEPKPIPGTDDARQPFFSPDGESIGFFANGALHRVLLSGGVPLRVCAVDRVPRGAAWGSDDTIVFATEQAPLSKVPAQGGSPQSILHTEQGQWPQILPDGKTVLFTIRQSAIATIALDGTGKRVIGRRDSFSGDGPVLAGEGTIQQARYVSTGHLIYGQGLRLVGARFDVTAFEIKGSPVALIDRVFRAPGGGAVYFAVSSTGVLVYAPDSNHYELSWVGRDGRAAVLGAAPRAYRFARVSPDGRHIAVNVDTDARRQEIWLLDAERGSGAPLDREQPSLMPVWAPDSRQIVSFGGGLTRQAVIGERTRDVLLADALAYPTAWSRNGKTVLFNRLTASDVDIWAIDVATKATRPLATGATNQYFGRFSPDGRWIAYMDNASGRYEVKVVSYPKLEAEVTVSVDGGMFPVWSPDGREIFYRRGTAVMVVPFEATAPIHGGQPRVLFDGPYMGASADRSFDVHPDGRFLLIKGDDAALGRQLNLVTNWFEDVKRILPGQ